MKKLLAFLLCLCILAVPAFAEDSRQISAVDVLKAFLAEDYTAVHNMLSPAVQSAITPGQLGQAWQSQLSLLGTYVSIAGMEAAGTAEALLLVEAEQKRKFSPEMVSLHLQLLLEAKDTNGATAMLDKVISAHPQYIGPHLLRQMLHRSYFKNEAKATAYANDTIEKLKSHPAVLSDFVQNEIKLPPGQGDPDLIYRAAVALKKAVTKLKGREKAVPLLIYAQAMNICGFNDRAAAAAAEAEKEFEKPQEKQSVEQIRKHFSKLDEVNKRYSSDK